jgi:hypothetical protein
MGTDFSLSHVEEPGKSRQYHVEEPGKSRQYYVILLL